MTLVKVPDASFDYVTRALKEADVNVKNFSLYKVISPAYTDECFRITCDICKAYVEQVVCDWSAYGHGIDFLIETMINFAESHKHVPGIEEKPYEPVYPKLKDKEPKLDRMFKS